MSRFIIETYKIGQRRTLYVVFFSHGYSDRWMKNPKGQPTIPCDVLKKMVNNCLQEKGELRYDFFNNYQKDLVDALYKRLVEKGKTNGAKEFSRQRAVDICATLRAIIVVEDKIIGSPKVHCLNKNPQSPVAFYDENSGIIRVDEKQWHVDGEDKENPVFIGSGNEGNLKKWWQQNHFLIWVSFFMLIVVPGLMIWGMLHIKKIAEQPNISPTPIQSPQYYKDSTSSATLLSDSLLTDSTSTKDNSINISK